MLHASMLIISQWSQNSWVTHCAMVSETSMHMGDTAFLHTVINFTETWPAGSGGGSKVVTERGRPSFTVSQATHSTQSTPSSSRTPSSTTSYLSSQTWKKLQGYEQCLPEFFRHFGNFDPNNEPRTFCPKYLQIFFREFGSFHPQQWVLDILIKKRNFRILTKRILEFWPNSTTKIKEFWSFHPKQWIFSKGNSGILNQEGNTENLVVLTQNNEFGTIWPIVFLLMSKKSKSWPVTHRMT